MLISLFVVVTVVVVVVFLIIINDGSSLFSYDSVETVGTNDAAEGDEQGTFDIETPYCTIHYPSKWKQYLKYTDSEENGVFKQTYYCVLNDTDFEIFSIYFGEVEGTTAIGKIMYDGEVIPFSVSSTSVISDGEFTEEEKEIILSMDVAINTIIDSVIASENYIG